MKEEDRVEMKRTTRDIRKMFQDRITQGGPTTTTLAATTTTTTAARRPPTIKVSDRTSFANLYSVKKVDKMCASPALTDGTSFSSCETIWSRRVETGRGGDGEQGARVKDDDGRAVGGDGQGVVVVENLMNDDE